MTNLTRSIISQIATYPDPEELPRGFVKLNANENPYEPSRKVFSAIVEKLPSINRYPVNPSRLRSLIADYTLLKPENVIIGNGSDEVINLLTKTFVDSGDEVVIPYPTFQMYDVAASIAGARVRTVKMLEGFKLDVNGILKAVTPKTKLIFLCSPNNPTGNTVAEDDVIAIAEKEALVIVDEAYVEFAQKPLTPALLKRSNLIFLRTFSKAFGLAGLRIGYGLGNPDVVAYMYRVKVPYNVNRLAIAAAEAALEDVEHVKRVTTQVKGARSRLYKRLREIKGLKPYPSEANFIFVDTAETGLASDVVVEALLKRGVAVRGFGNLRGFRGSYFRVTVGTPSENECFLTALKAFITGG